MIVIYQIYYSKYILHSIFVSLRTLKNALMFIKSLLHYTCVYNPLVIVKIIPTQKWKLKLLNLMFIIHVKNVKKVTKYEQMYQ